MTARNRAREWAEDVVKYYKANPSGATSSRRWITGDVNAATEFLALETDYIQCSEDYDVLEAENARLTAALAEQESLVRALREENVYLAAALLKVCNNVGVPTPEYPAPFAYAYEVAKMALDLPLTAKHARIREAEAKVIEAARNYFNVRNSGGRLVTEANEELRVALAALDKAKETP